MWYTHRREESEVYTQKRGEVSVVHRREAIHRREERSVRYTEERRGE